MLKRIGLWINGDAHTLCKQMAEYHGCNLTQMYERIFDEGFTSYYENFEKEKENKRRLQEKEREEREAR